MARPALSAVRALEVLNFLASNSPEQYSLSDLGAQLGINLASAHAVMAALLDAGYVVRHPRLRTYSLGPAVAALGSAALQCHPAVDHAREEAKRLSGELDLAVAVTALAGEEIVFLARIGEHRPRDIDAHVGQRIPLTPPIGAVFVAWGDSSAWLAKADHAPLMQEVLDAVRERGWAASLHGEGYHLVGDLSATATYDVVMVAAPVFGTTGDALVSLTLLGLPGGLTAQELDAYGEKVREAGLLATRRSGGRAPGTARPRQTG